MAKFNFLGIPVTIGFDNDLVEKYNRYNELNEETWDDEKPVENWDEWGKKMDEQIKLFHELREESVDFGGEPEPVEEQPRSWLGRLFG